ncbi:MAG TPA: hypothetical protein VER03_25700 [Bryobacteraceae bacterium]|nr:hypothetical protein [Bryobacteraceae bacterium]
MSNALRQVLTVPKEAILKVEAKLKEANEKGQETGVLKAMSC